MKFKIGHLVALVLTLGSLSVCSCERTVMDYLLTIRSDEHRHQAELDWIRQQVEEKGGLEPDETRKYLERAERMAKLVAHGEPTPDEAEDDTGVVGFEPRSSITVLWALLDRLLSLSLERSETQCSSHGAIDFLTIFNKTFGEPDNAVLAKYLKTDEKPDHDVKLFNYMKHYATEKYRKCLEHADFSDFRNSRVEYDIILLEQELDAIFSLGKAEPYADDKLLEIAKELDLANGKYKAKKMSNFIEDFSSETHTHGSRSKATFLSLDKLCQKFRHRSADTFDTYNLGRALARVKVRVDCKFLKLNEYSRLCIQFQDPVVREAVRANIRSNMEWWVKKQIKKLAD